MRLGFDLIRRLIREALLNAYEVLGVPASASDDEIKAAWKRLAVVNHPDKGGSHGKMVDINNAKDRLLNRDELMRRGPSIKGFEDPNAPKLEECPVCHRQVNIKDGKFLNHYSKPGGPNKCSNSGKAPDAGKKGGARSDDSWVDFIRRAQEAARRKREEDERRARERDRQPDWARPPPREEPRRPDWGQRASGARPETGGTPDPYRVRYYEFTAGTSNKFWEVKVNTDSTVTVNWGRKGTEGQTQTKTFPGNYEAMRWARNMIESKLEKGYREAKRPASRNAANPQPEEPRAEAGAGGGDGKQYKVYGNVKNKDKENFWPHTRVKGKAYAPTGKLKGKSRFYQNDRVSVAVNGKKAKVSGKIKDYSPRPAGQPAGEKDHSQDWDEITQEARRLIDDAVIELLYERAFRR